MSMSASRSLGTTAARSFTALWLLALLIAGGACNGQGAAPAQPGTTGPGTTDPPTQTEAMFDGDAAFELLEAQCDFGPRVPGTEAHRKCGDWLLEKLAEYCDEAYAQDFTHVSTRAFPGQSFEMRNLIGIIEPAGGAADDAREVVLLAHWDSRPFADHDPDPTKRDEPVLGANDGASGVAGCLEIARALSVERPPTRVIVLLTDGEDFGISEPTLSEYFLGAKHFVRNLGDLDPKRGILLDMIGDDTLELGREWNSYNADPALVERIWAKAAELGYGDVFGDTTYTVSDDHVPLIQAGIPTVDLIDWRPEVTRTYWHTTFDTPDRCSPDSLQAVGDVVLAVLREGI
jgi:Zn-dependent M28 family amino/carboxypeptidase